MFKAEKIAITPEANTRNSVILLKTFSSTLLESLIPKDAPRKIMGTITAEEVSKSIVMRFPST